ncbi:MAG: hypothetical protein HOJ90_03055 [Alphaproteobacteria bacterium]|jgi:hypothetical protein|nr:hypothetical protein [Alphaproteobacteria bacterium]
MTVSGTPTSLQSLLSQLQQATPTQAAPVAQRSAETPVQRAAAEPRVTVPSGTTALDPNAPRGTYLNLKV